MYCTVVEGTCISVELLTLFYCSVQVLTIKQYHSTVEMGTPKNHEAKSIKQTTVGSFWMIDEDSVRLNQHKCHNSEFVSLLRKM